MNIAEDLDNCSVTMMHVIIAKDLDTVVLLSMQYQDSTAYFYTNVSATTRSN